MTIATPNRLILRSRIIISGLKCVFMASRINFRCFHRLLTWNSSRKWIATPFKDVLTISAMKMRLKVILFGLPLIHTDSFSSLVPRWMKNVTLRHTWHVNRNSWYIFLRIEDDPAPSRSTPIICNHTKIGLKLQLNSIEPHYFGECRKIFVMSFLRNFRNKATTPPLQTIDCIIHRNILLDEFLIKVSK